MHSVITQNFSTNFEMEEIISVWNNISDSLTYCIAFVKMLDHIRDIGRDCIPNIQSVISIGVVGQENFVFKTCTNIAKTNLAKDFV